jgi:CDGSH iron-sulfur domain-containing protein 3
MATPPKIPQKFPYLIEEEPGTRFWCACGQSLKQPYCDGSHKGTGFEPVKVEIEKKRRVAWCGCKFSGRPPFCDGSHGELP